MSQETGRLSGSVQRAVRDVVLIVFSILIAFWLDGWREDQADRGILLQHLGALADEFEQTAMIIDTELQSVERSMEGTRSLLEMMGPDAAPDPDSARAALIPSLTVGIFTAQDPVLTAMLASGELIDLRNDSLMARLSEWRDRMGHLRTDSEHLERNRQEMIFGRFIELGQPFGGFNEEMPEWATRFDQREMSVLLTDPALRVIFVLRLNRKIRLARDYQAAIAEAQSIAALIEAEAPKLGGG